jgi:anti-sigma factor (TIGR02949 family)
MNRPEMIPCDHVIAKLWEYIDGELTEESAAQVREHLDICSRCFPQYDFQRAFKEFTHRSAQKPTPPELRRRVFEAIIAEEAGQPLRGAAPAGLLDRLRAGVARLFGRNGR